MVVNSSDGRTWKQNQKPKNEELTCIWEDCIVLVIELRMKIVILSFDILRRKELTLTRFPKKRQ